MLELAAMQNLAKDVEANQAMRREKAVELACRFSQAASPIFSALGRQDCKAPFHTWGQKDDEWLPRLQKITAAFEAALRLKAMCAGAGDSDEYEVVFPTAEHITGSVMTLDGNQISLKPTGGFRHEVDVCLHPGFHVYRGHGLKDATSLADAVVTSRPFAQYTPSFQKTASIKTMAVVLLKKNPVQAALPPSNLPKNSVYIDLTDEPLSDIVDRQIKSVSAAKVASKTPSIVPPGFKNTRPVVEIIVPREKWAGGEGSGGCLQWKDKGKGKARGF